MLYGETGTGKELFAQSIHNNSARKKNLYVAINCAAIPENLLEGILFGTSRGAFTGAMEKAGIFEKAHGGTLLLDEVNSMPIGLQAKLLRILQEKKVRRVGSLQETDIDVKIISSTNESLQTACNQGRFRRDLLYRLGVVFIQIPPLRQRKRDMETLIGHFLHKCNTYLEKNIDTISSEVMELFHTYHWPGNVRELEHVIEGAMNMLGDKAIITMAHLSVHIGSFAPSLSDISTRPFQDIIHGGQHGISPVAGIANHGQPRVPHPLTAEDQSPIKSLTQLQLDNEIKTIRQALEESRGNGAKAARQLGISPQLLHFKTKKYGINRMDFKPPKKQ